MINWIVDTIHWTYLDYVHPYVDLHKLSEWLFDGAFPLALSLLIINSLFLMFRLFNAAGGANSDWDSRPTLFLQGALIFGNISVIAVDASARGWL